MTKMILNEVRDELIDMGLAENEPEFCVAWLGRGVGYMRTLRHLGQEPSAEALAILASKLGHYTQRLWRGGDSQAGWAARFANTGAHELWRIKASTRSLPDRDGIW